MDFTNYTAGTNDEGRRLDKILKHIFRQTEGANIYSALRKKLIKVNNAKTSGEYILHAGDSISIASFLLNTQQAKQEEDLQYNFETIFQNEHILVINKPYNLNVQSSKANEISIAGIIKNQCKKTDSIAFTPAPLHRLDRYTTGVLAISQSQKGALWFSEAIASHTIKKTYIGIAEGNLKERVTWEDFIENQENTADSYHKVTIAEGGKKAITHATPIAYGSYRNTPVTLVQYEIETGRKHQIRIQSSTHEHPLLGDSAYNCKRIIDIPSKRAFCLHAICLSIPEDNPLNLPSQITAPLPKDFLDIMQISLLKWDNKLII